MTRLHPHPVRGIIFDLDGTLTVPALDFDAIRADIGHHDRSIHILEHLDTLPEDERRRCYRILERHEAEAARHSRLSPGVAQVLQFLRDRRIKIGVVTRNSRVSVDAFCRKHGVGFDVVITREDAPPKPSPVPLTAAIERLGLGRQDVIYVGDFEMDRLTGQAAGVATYIVQHYPQPRDNAPAEMRIANLTEIIDIVRGETAP